MTHSHTDPDAADGTARRRPRLRFGIMCQSRHQLPQWQVECLSQLMALHDVELALIVVPKPASPSSRRFLDRITRGGLLWHLYNKGYVERRSRASRPLPVDYLLEGVPVIECEVVAKGRFKQAFRDEDLAQFISHDVDFMLRLSFGILTGGVLEAFRFGVWSFHHGDEREYRGRPPGFWELYKGGRTLGAILQVLSDRLDGGHVLHRGTFRAFPHSYRRTRDEVLLGAADFPARVCKELLTNSLHQLPGTLSSTRAPVRRNPTNLQFLGFLGRQTWAFVRNTANALLFSPRWAIGVVDAQMDELLKGHVSDQLTWIQASNAHEYLADPFGLPDGRVLAERYDYRTRQGRIVAIDAKGTYTSESALPTTVHASYPYVVEDGDGSLYCVPETHRASEVRLYRLNPESGQWLRDSAVIKGLAALDPTLFRHGGLWWLLCGDKSTGGDAKLYGFYSESLRGPYTPHPLNPLKTDVSSSRPAGTPFYYGRLLHRPAQDDSVSYGAGLAICRIEELTTDSFEETVVCRLSASATWPYPHGLHTASGWGEKTLIDARRDGFLWAGFTHELRTRLRQFLRIGGPY